MHESAIPLEKFSSGCQGRGEHPRDLWRVLVSWITRISPLSVSKRGKEFEEIEKKTFLLKVNLAFDEFIKDIKKILMGEIKCIFFAIRGEVSVICIDL